MLADFAHQKLPLDQGQPHLLHDFDHVFCTLLWRIFQPANYCCVDIFFFANLESMSNTSMSKLYSTFDNNILVALSLVTVLACSNVQGLLMNTSALKKQHGYINITYKERSHWATHTIQTYIERNTMSSRSTSNPVIFRQNGQQSSRVGTEVTYNY